MTIDLLWIAFGGALGALTRFGIGEWVRLRTRWPGWLAIFAANLLGTALLAVAHFTIGQTDVVPPAVWAFAALGYCGALTTYSALGLDTLLLWYEGQRAVAVLQFCATLGLGAAIVGVTAAALADKS